MCPTEGVDDPLVSRLLMYSTPSLRQSAMELWGCPNSRGVRVPEAIWTPLFLTPIR